MENNSLQMKVRWNYDFFHFKPNQIYVFGYYRKWLTWNILDMNMKNLYFRNIHHLYLIHIFYHLGKIELFNELQNYALSNISSLGFF